jgi:hypothetical protein
MLEIFANAYRVSVITLAQTTQLRHQSKRLAPVDAVRQAAPNSAQAVLRRRRLAIGLET